MSLMVKKTYLEVKIAQMLDRSIPVQDAMWDELIDSHMFKGNDTWLPLDWYEGTAMYAFVICELEAEGFEPDKHEIMLKVEW